MSENYDPCGLRDVIRQVKLIQVRHPEVNTEDLLNSIAALNLIVDPLLRHAKLAKHVLSLGQEFARGHGAERDESGQSKLGEMALEVADELYAYERSTRGL